jgi:hypothetical protein
MADRTWTVRVNLDDLGAEMLALDDDAERGAWLAGFQVGASGAPFRETWSEAKRRGWDFGAAAFAEAEEFRAKKAAAGEASASARRAKTGSAQPVKPTGNRPPLEQSSNDVRTELEQTAEQASNQPSSNSQQPLAENQEPSPPTPPRGRRARPGTFVPPTDDEAKAFAAEIGFAEVDRFLNHYQANGWMVGKVRMSDWKACIRNWAANRFAPPGAPRAPAARASADQSWATRNAAALKPYTPKPGENHGPAW